ncbi:MAG: isoprenylcysteine carboxyl methyltransferase, partial [Candidatus Rokubacteria bacterium]|nr:isoprenylcysteine carboxyl methyltransferase [Candidatus Rokubacteria bacterium]
MKLAEGLARTGDTLFRWRSYLPLLLLPAVVTSFIGLRYPGDSHVFGLAWEIGCFLLAMAGFAGRVYTVGTAPRGT